MTIFQTIGIKRKGKKPIKIFFFIVTQAHYKCGYFHWIQVTGEDVGTYKVTLSNDLGEASTQGKLTLSGAPQFKEKIADQKTGVDEPYKIKAVVSGEPELTW